MRSRVVLFVVLATIFVFGKPVSSSWHGYEYYEGVGHYKYVSTELSMEFQDAYDECMSDAGYLVIINGENEAKVVKELQDQEESGNENWWTGIEYHDGSWRDIKGNSIESTGHVKWGPGQPQEPYNEKSCVATNAEVEYYNYPCDEEFPFICEVNI